MKSKKTDWELEILITYKNSM